MFLDQKWRTRIKYDTLVNDRIIVVRFKVARECLCVTGIYAAENGNE